LNFSSDYNFRANCTLTSTQGKVILK
jgi:hypothetical protein